MTNISVYLTFDGNCKEAMNFYKEAMGAELTMQTVGESPMADKMPAEKHDKIMHSSLLKDGTLLLMASDMMMNLRCWFQRKKYRMTENIIYLGKGIGFRHGLD
jgi:PhnB protein